MMRRLMTVFAWLSLLVASPALADAPAHLVSLETQLRTIAKDSPAEVGIAALDLKSGEMVSFKGDTPFPMASVVKVAIAANYLAQVENGRRSLDDMIGGQSARTLLARMMIHSDNAATDKVLADLGGPATIQAWMRQQGLDGIRIDRTIAQLLAAKRDLMDERDSATPKAFVKLLQKLDSGVLLRPQSRAYLLNLMAQCATGRNRLKGQLPGVKIEHKTGTLNGLSTDVGFITLPDGRRLAVAVFARYGTNRPNAIAAAARSIYDGFRSVVAAPFSLGFNTTGRDPLAPLPTAAALH